MTKIRCNSWTDDIEDWYINDKHVINANHDDLGWSGMGMIRNVFEIFAKELKVEIDETDEDPDEVT